MHAARPRTTLLVSFTWAADTPAAVAEAAASDLLAHWADRRLPATLALDADQWAAVPAGASRSLPLDAALRLSPDWSAPGRQRATLCDALARAPAGGYCAVFHAGDHAIEEHADLLAKRRVAAVCPIHAGNRRARPRWWQRLLGRGGRVERTAAAAVLRYGVWNVGAAEVELRDAARAIGAAAQRCGTAQTLLHWLVDLSIELRQPQRLRAGLSRLAAQVEGLEGRGAVALSTPGRLVAERRGHRSRTAAHSILRARAA
jgi:hypothetical protein